MPNDLNIWKTQESTRYMLRHPVVSIKRIFKTFKWAWQRTTKGFSEFDAWEMDNYLFHLLPDMLDALAEEGHGYPEMIGTLSEDESADCVKFRNGEEWNAYLHEIAQHFRNADESQSPEQNEFADLVSPMYFLDCDKDCLDHSIIAQRELYWDQFVQRDRELQQYYVNELHHAMDMLKLAFFALWD